MASTTKKKKDLDIERIRFEFPILQQDVNGHPLVYFDNAATNQKPREVINTLEEYYTTFNANIHRGIHTLAETATTAFEETRKAVKEFINAPAVEEVIFTKGTTESINLVAQSFGRKFLGEGDEVILSTMEHHSNIVPWQLACEASGAKLRIIPMSDQGVLDLEAYYELLSPKTKMVAVVHASNSLGTINPVKEIVRASHATGAKVLIDGAQASSHLEVDVMDLDCDFYVFSGHKMYGPTGTGVLWGKRPLLEAMPPYQGGGEMIKDVKFSGTTYNDIPYKFEAGTPNIADVVALKSAIHFIQRIGKPQIAAHEQKLLKHAQKRLEKIAGVQLIGTAPDKVSVASFLVDGVHPFDLGMWLDARGIAVRTGHHCTQPLMERLGIEGTVRASFSVYNTSAEIDYFADSLEEIIKKFRA